MVAEVVKSEPPIQRVKKPFSQMNRADLEAPLDDILSVYRANAESSPDVPEHLVHLINSEKTQSRLAEIVKNEVKVLLENGILSEAVELSTWLHSTMPLVADSKLNDMAVALSAAAGPSVWVRFSTN